MKTPNFKFYEKRKILFGISIGVILIGVIFNFIFGTTLDIQFTGGAVIKYSYTGEVDQDKIASVISGITGNQAVSVTVNEAVANDSTTETANHITVSFGGTDSLELSEQQEIIDALTKEYPDAGFAVADSKSVSATMGSKFFLKCLAAVGIAAVLLILYITLRFRKIGGASAGVTAIVALLHDIILVYFTFVIFRMPLNDNFIAVILTILGYSLNNTIVVYDRVRENRKIMGPKAELSDLIDKSINQTLTRSVYTSIAVFASVATVYVVGVIYNLSSIQTFALPLMVGVVVGCYSSVCIAGPLYTMWQYAKKKKDAAKAKNNSV